MTAGELVAKREKRRCITILGMHRSGTSALARVINLLGATIPGSAAPPRRQAKASRNPRKARPASKHWEPYEVMVLHRRLLRALGSDWDDPRRIDEVVLRGEAARAARGELADLLGSIFLGADLLVVKDPRACRLVPLWHDLLADLEADFLAVIPMRSHGEVARSLAARSGTPADQAVALWLRHVIDAEAATRQVNRAFVWYDDLLADPVSTADRIGRQLDLVWPNPPESARAEIESFISPGLRHHAREAAPLPGTLSPLAARVTALMEQLAARPYDTAAITELDEIGAALDRATGVIRPHVPLDVV